MPGLTLVAFWGKPAPVMIHWTVRQYDILQGLQSELLRDIMHA